LVFGGVQLCGLLPWRKKTSAENNNNNTNKNNNNNSSAPSTPGTTPAAHATQPLAGAWSLLQGPRRVFLWLLLLLLFLLLLLLLLLLSEETSCARLARRSCILLLYSSRKPLKTHLVQLSVPHFRKPASSAEPLEDSDGCPSAFSDFKRPQNRQARGLPPAIRCECVLFFVSRGLMNDVLINLTKARMHSETGVK
jgi:hypothetical protein